MRDVVVFFVNGVRREAGGRGVFRPLSSFLREELGLVGTKVVCAEGDCGSCSILLGRVRAGRLKYEAVCSCIQYVYQLDGMHVVTVEGLAYEGNLNPVQEAMVKCQGSQCGYCTPGFVVAMCGVLEENRSPTKAEWTRALVGNLCRCTGYESILAAGMAVDGASMRGLDALFDGVGIARELSAREKEAVEIADGDYRFSKPVRVADAVAFRAAHPGCVIVSGGTDIGVQANKGLREVRCVLSTAGLRELESVRVEGGKIVAGARASLSELERVSMEVLPELGKMLAWFGSPLIKNAGTIGGNIANGSPIGDSMPGMFALDAEVELTGMRGVRRVNINAFYTGYRKTVMAGDELITGVSIPLLGEMELFKIYKISKRKDLDISSLMAAIWMRVGDGVIEDVRIACGGVAATVVRLPGAEAVLHGQVMSEELFRRAGIAARAEIRPLSDVRGSAEYRLQLAENLLHKFYWDAGSRELVQSNEKGAL